MCGRAGDDGDVPFDQDRAFTNRLTDHGHLEDLVDQLLLARGRAVARVEDKPVVDHSAQCRFVTTQFGRDVLVLGREDTLLFGLEYCLGRRRLRMASKQQQAQTDRRGQGLDEKNPPTCRHGPKQPCQDDAAQEEHLDGQSVLAKHETPSQPRRKEPVIEALIASQDLGGFCRFARLAEDLQPDGFGPQEHLQDQEVDMQKGHQCHDQICCDSHLPLPPFLLG